MKRIKMCLYGEPGVGKSVFASKAPKPLFVCSDGNYEWLEDFGADPNAHKDVSSFAEAKKVFADKDLLANYDTIVVDLLEDLFKWCEAEYCGRNKIDHVSDVGYGKGYDITRNEFFVEISKLLSMDKNVILIMHGVTTQVKDRRGVEHTKYVPSPRIPDKVLDMIEGRVRYFLRCYLKAEETEDNVLVKRRYLSIVPKENEFGIIRGVNENLIPHDIPLDFNEFASVIGLDLTNEPISQPIVEETTPKKIPTSKGRKSTLKVEPVVEQPKEEVEETVEKVTINDVSVETKEAASVKVEKQPEPTVKVEEPKPIQSQQPESIADKRAAILARLAASKRQ